MQEVTKFQIQNEMAIMQNFETVRNERLRRANGVKACYLEISEEAFDKVASEKSGTNVYGFDEELKPGFYSLGDKVVHVFDTPVKGLDGVVGYIA